MKKLLCLLLSLVMGAAALSMTACGDKGEADTSNAPIIFDDPESSSSSKTTKNSGNSEKPNASSAGDTGGLPSYTAEQPVSSKGGTTTSTNAPSVSISGTGYTVTQITPDPSLPILTVIAVKSINGIGYVQYNAGSKNKIETARQLYNDLPNDQKTLIASSYAELQKAEASYAELAAEASLAYVEMFKTKVNALGEFEYTTGYKALLDECNKIYSSIVTSQQTNISTEYNKLKGLLTLYADTTCVNEFFQIYTALPEVADITASNKGPAQKCVKLFNAMTQAQKTLVTARDAGVATKIGQYQTTITANYPSGEWSVDAKGANNTTHQIKFGTNNSLTLKVKMSGVKSGSGAITFSDGSSFTNFVTLSSGSCSIQPPYGGTISVYITGSGTLTIDGQVATATSSGLIFDYTVSGNSGYTMSASGTINLYAVIFS